MIVNTKVHNIPYDETFIKIGIVGKGTYGSVYKAYLKSNKKHFYAIKKLDTSQEKEGFPITALREIMLLQQLDHPNIVKYLRIDSSKSDLIRK